MSDLMQLLAADIANKSRISMIWVDLLLRQDLPLHIAAVEPMSPYMFCTRAYVIIRSGYLRNMQTMPFDILKQCIKGKHTIMPTFLRKTGTWSPEYGCQCNNSDSK